MDSDSDIDIDIDVDVDIDIDIGTDIDIDMDMTWHASVFFISHCKNYQRFFVFIFENLWQCTVQIFVPKQCLRL